MIRILYNILFLITRSLGWLRGREHLKKDDVNRILVIELTKLGDVVSSFPFFGALKKLFPHSSIGVMVRREHADLFPLIPEVDDVLQSSSTNGLASFLENLHIIRKGKYNFVVSASPSVRHGLLVLFSGARYKYGYLDYTRAKVLHLQPHRIRSLGFRLPEKSTRQPTNITERTSLLCESLGIPVPAKFSFSVPLTAEATRKSETSGELGLVNGISYILLHPLASWTYRVWPIENFRQLIRKILISRPEHLLIIGTEEDRISLHPLAEEFADHARVKFAVGLCLRQLASVLENAVLFVGSDSGPLHLAAAVGTPSVGLFGPAPPELTGPLVGKNEYLYKKVECSPCDQLDCVRKWAPCMTLISVDEVFERVNQLLRQPSSRRVATLPGASG